MICAVMVSAFPQARVLCLSRDPADVAASFRRRRTLQTGPEGEWLDVACDLSRFVDYWNYRVAAWKEFQARFGDCGRVVDYERLTTEPDVVLGEVLSFIGEAMEPHLLAGARAEELPAWLDRYDSHVPVQNSDVWGPYLSELEATWLRAGCVPVRSRASGPKGTGRSHHGGETDS